VHPILARQLRQLGNLPSLRGQPDFEHFLEAISQTYSELESDRRFAEHTLRTVSAELFVANETIRKESDRQIASQGAQLATAMQSAGDGLWSFESGSGKIEFSPAWLEMLGYGSEEFPAGIAACERLVHPDDWEGAKAALNGALASDEIFAREIRVLSRSGEIFWMNVRGRVVERDAQGRAQWLVGTLVNITVQKQIEDDLRAAKEAAETANAAKSRFLAIMSHEIRTPMNGVLGFTELLSDTPLSVQQRECVDMIESSGKILVAIINDILDFSRIESGLFQLAHERFSPARVAADICDLLRPQAQAKGIRLESAGCEKTVGEMVGDSLRFRQILLNLIGNAIKFTEVGCVEIRLSRSFGVAGESWLALEVRDTGAGIPLQNLQSIFEPFAQGDMSITRKYGGTGLGLAITRRLVEIMGGSIEVESVQGAGALFRVKLPSHSDTSPLAENGRSEPERESDSGAALPKIHTLVVEDNRISRLLAVRLLHTLGCEVAVAEDGRQAVEMVKDRSFDVVFMDMDMPVMDGVTATRLIRATPGRETLPIFALSANALETDRALCLEAGMNGFVSKPYEKAVIARVLSRVPVRHLL